MARTGDSHQPTQPTTHPQVLLGVRYIRYTSMQKCQPTIPTSQPAEIASTKTKSLKSENLKRARFFQGFPSEIDNLILLTSIPKENPWVFWAFKITLEPPNPVTSQPNQQRTSPVFGAAKVSPPENNFATVLGGVGLFNHWCPLIRPY